MQKIKTGDTVEVIAGKDKGKRGEVLRVDRKAGRLVVEGVNVVKKHQRPIRAGRRNTQAGIIEYEAPIDASNVMLVDPQSGQRTRVGFRFDADGRKIRYAKKSGQDID
ncbi:MAG: 50S ribosomal protein L24 [Anaerolineales bacterium]